MKRVSLCAIPLFAASLALLPQLASVRAAPAPPAAPVPATRYYPLSIGNRWEYGIKRVISFSMTPASGEPTTFPTTIEGTQTVEIVREDGERSGERGKVFVQRATETARPTGEGSEDAPPAESRLVGETYFRVNDRGIWLIADGEADDKGENIEKVNDRRLPLLWTPSDLKTDKSWTITCQLDDSVTARVTSRVGKPQTLRVAGATYENCLPVVSIAENVSGRLDMGIGLAPIKSGRLVDITWYAPRIGVVRTHQLANFDLEPPSDNFTEAKAKFEETQELQPGYRVTE